MAPHSRRNSRSGTESKIEEKAVSLPCMHLDISVDAIKGSLTVLGNFVTIGGFMF